MKKTAFLATILFFVSCFTFAQRSNTWYFGANAGLNFNTNPPSILTNGVINDPDNVSAISNSAGSLLFYTDGMTVWNRNHVAMPNGTGLIGNFTAGQCGLIVPVPCDTNKYIIFQNTEFASPGNLNYSVVDMNLAAGFGDVVSSQKNVSLGSGWTEKLCAYYNAAGNFYWVLAHKWSSNEFVAFKVNTTGVSTQTVSSFVGTVHNCGTYSGAHDAQGELTISPDGSKIVNALTCQNKIELYDFNLSTGAVSNAISFTAAGTYAWGAAFSPDSKKIYTSSILGTSIFQYDISAYNVASILLTQTAIATVGSSGYNFGYIELGPDGKVYIARPSQNALSVVNNPNATGAASNFSLAGQSLGSKTSTHGLCRAAFNIPGSTSGNNSLISVVASPSVICPGQLSTLTASGSSTYSWSNNATGSVITVGPNQSSVFTVSSTVNFACVSTIQTASAQVQVLPKPLLAISGNTLICYGNQASLTASGAATYTWNTGATTPIYTFTPTSTLTFTVNGNLAGSPCQGTRSITVYISECLGIESQLSENIEVEAYPNPFTNEIRIRKISGRDISSLHILDISGREIKCDFDCSFEKDVDEILISTGSFSPGIYFLNLDAHGTSKAIKVIKL